jgi:Domain of unknown function (DUF6249)
MDFGPFAVAIAFWTFVAIATVAGIFSDYKKRQLALEPLRQAIEKGQQLDPAVVERLMAPVQEPGMSPIHLRVGGIIVISAGVGIAILSFFIAHLAPVAFYPLMGGGLVTVCVGIGLVIAANAVERARSKEVRGPAV